MNLKKILNVILLLILITSCQEKKMEQTQEQISPQHQLVIDRMRAYAPIHLSVDKSNLSENQLKLIQKLSEAGKIADRIFWYQSSHDAIAIRDSLTKISTNEAKDFLSYVLINYGPYDPIYDNKRFVGLGSEIRPKTGGFYPEDMTKEEFESFLQNNPDKAKQFKDQYSVIIREDMELKAVPYHLYYKEIEELAKTIEEAAAFADNESFKKYLLLRAIALRSDQYYESDLAWMDIENSDIDFVIGPIENYQDELFNYKSAFEAVVMVKDPVASKELEMYKVNMQNFENSLPLEDKFKQKNIGEGNKIQVMNVVYFGGDCQQAIKTIAAALPNDPKVAEAKGRKLSMYKNHMEAKFDKIVKPVGDILISPEIAKLVDKKAFTSFVTLHEVSHALGPKYVFRTKIDVREALKDQYSAIEECKADVLSMYNHIYLQEKSYYSPEYIEKAKATYLAGLYRSIRFGTGAHATANFIQLNFLKEKKAIYKNEQGKLVIDFKIFFSTISDLANIILTIQIDGSYQKATDLINKYGKITPEIETEIELLKDIPRDINTTYDF